MLNQIVLVGRIAEINKEEKGATIKLLVKRTFKNEEGVYEDDCIPVKLSVGIASNTIEYIGIDDIVGVKGRIQMCDNSIQLIAEKVTFLSSGRPRTEEGE